jgi:hypothetical protein
MKNNPGLRQKIAGMMLLEGAKDPVPVVESLMNRMDFTGGSLEKGLHSGFYGPINRGQLPGALRRLQNNPKLAAKMDAAIDQALGGSNTIRGATDQGLPTDPNGRWMGGRIMRGGNVFNDWGGGRSAMFGSGHAGAQRYREWLQSNVQGEADAAAFDHRDAMNQAIKNEITGSARIQVDVNAPKGTKVSTDADGMFDEVQLNRSGQMRGMEGFGE